MVVMMMIMMMMIMVVVVVVGLINCLFQLIIILSAY